MSQIDSSSAHPTVWETECSDLVTDIGKEEKWITKLLLGTQTLIFLIIIQARAFHVMFSQNWKRRYLGGSYRL